MRAERGTREPGSRHQPRPELTSQVKPTADQPTADRRPRILLIGPLPPPIGGATRLFSYLVDDLRADPSCQVEVLDTGRPEHRNTFWANALLTVRTIGGMIRRGRSCDVISLHANERGRTLLGPIAFVVARLLRRPLVVRAFAGGFDDQLRRLGSIHRWIVERTYLRADACLLETRHLVEHFSSVRGCRALWFPNYTRTPERTRAEPVEPSRQCSRQCSRLVFISRVLREKGIEVMLEAGERLDPEITIDVYGPLAGYTADELNARGAGRLRYRGVLDAAAVQLCLSRHDALVLPTLLPGEGYPGAILEAFANGRPVIASSVRSIREIVDETCGLLVPPGDVAAFTAAVNRLHRDASLFARLSSGSLERARQFSDVVQTARFLSICRSLLS